MDDEVIMEKELQGLRDTHQQVNGEMKRLMDSPFQNQLGIMRLKKKMLQLKDAMCRVEERLYPDIIA